MKTLIAPLALAATLLTAAPIHPVQASMFEESGIAMINRKCREAKSVANTIFRRMDATNLAIVDKATLQASLDFGGKAIVQIETMATNCVYQEQLELKSAFLNRWDVWMDQLLIRNHKGGDQ
jgi:hypothetical protein